MDHNFCFNSLSLPAPNPKEAYKLLIDAFLGMLEINSGEDRFFLYYADKNNTALPDSLLTEEGYTYSNFLDDLFTNNEIDLYSFIVEIEDKSPALDHLIESDDILERLTDFNYYIPDEAGTTGKDILAITWFLNSHLLSLNTKAIWAHLNVSIARFNDTLHKQEEINVYNISCLEHGKLLYEKWKQEAEKPLQDLCPHCIFSDSFLQWYDDLGDENRRRVKEKLILGEQRRFQGGKPLFDTLKDAVNLREIRLNSYPGGAIRILFKTVPENKQIILIGFTKKSAHEGYETNIFQALKILEKYKSDG